MVAAPTSLFRLLALLFVVGQTAATAAVDADQAAADNDALLAALKRVILNAAPADLFKNLSRITFYRRFPVPQTQVVSFPAAAETELQRPTKNATITTSSSSLSSFPQPFYARLGQFANPCVLPQQVGTGPYRIPRWFFNPEHAHCEPFYWSGCCGNSNNFQTRELCVRACEGQQQQQTLIYLPVSLSLSLPPHAHRRTAVEPRLTPHPPQASPELSPPQFPINDDASAEWPEESSNGWPAVPVQVRPTNGTMAVFPSLETPVMNPCAYGAGQMMLCQPAAAPTCPGQQFCHVGDSPVTTVCCNKPAIDVCHQPLNVGVGRSSLQRWYFYAPAGQCQSFMYNGLQGNENNFLSRVDCESICQPNPCAVGSPLRDPRGQIGYCSAGQANICPGGYYCHVGGDAATSMCCPMMAGDPCTQPLNSGQGYYKLQRWYWDAGAQQCRPFVYCGQKGTQNNFLSQEECAHACYVEPNPCRLPIDPPLQQCVPGPGACDSRPDLYCHVGATPATTVCCPADQVDKCAQPVEPGEGSAQLSRFAYDAQTQQCRPFVYRGLKGNQNNFLEQEECELACLPNPCPSGTPFVGADGRIQSCAVSTSMSTCPAGHWCHVGANSATTVCCPDANPNPCQLPMSTGEGFAALDRFYFDSASKSCKAFIYRGLKGNQNNFLTLRACQLTCLPLDNPCIGQPAKSPSGQVLFCSATNRDTCPVNFWCHLGAIPETTVCCPGATNPCSVPLAPGTGNAGLARWYYNADERQCVSFQYNGKRGNQNNFLTQDECQNSCPAQLCLLSIDRGACSGRQTRYAFDRQKGECVPFEYSGCGGNLNNFLTMQECQQVCGTVRI